LEEFVVVVLLEGGVVVVAESLPDVGAPLDIGPPVTALYIADIARLDDGNVGYGLRYFSASREYFIASMELTCNQNLHRQFIKYFNIYA
jgi:hypothetical protein